MPTRKTKPTAPKDPFTKRLQRSAGRIRAAGGIVCLHHAASEIGRSTYQLLDGRPVMTHIVGKLLELGILERGGDGLFAGADQTFHLVKK